MALVSNQVSGFHIGAGQKDATPTRDHRRWWSGLFSLCPFLTHTRFEWFEWFLIVVWTVVLKQTATVLICFGDEINRTTKNTHFFQSTEVVGGTD